MLSERYPSSEMTGLTSTTASKMTGPDSSPEVMLISGGSSAATSARELKKIYKLKVVVIPTNRPLWRTALPTAVFASDEQKWSSVVEEVRALHAAGRPVLVSNLDGLSEQVPPALLIAGPTAGAIAERIRWLATQDLRALGEALRPSTNGAEARHYAGWAAILGDTHGRAVAA